MSISRLVVGLLMAGGLRLHAAAPANDDFRNAILLAGTNLTVTATNVGASKEPGEPDHGADPGGSSVWWQWVAPGAGSVIVITTGSSFDTTLGAYTGSTLAGLSTNVVANNDDAIGAQTSIVGFDTQPGMTYFIAVDGYGGDSGQITLNLTYTPAPLRRPVNDNFANASRLGGAQIETIGTNLFATVEPGEPNPADAPGGASIWWVWTAPLTGDVTIDTEGSNVDTALGVYTGASVSQLQLIASNDDISTNQPNSRVTFHATANTVYDIAVDGYDGEPGNIHLDIAMAQAVFTLAPPRSLPDGSHTVTLTGQPGQRYTLESSTDLRVWQPVATLPSNSSGIVEFSDPAVNVPVRFYRASLAGGG